MSNDIAIWNSKMCEKENFPEELRVFQQTENTVTFTNDKTTITCNQEDIIDLKNIR